MNALQKSGLHFRYRWVGLPLFISGGCLFLFTLSSYRETGDWFVCLLGFGSTMLGLTSFGINHDTAVAYALEAEKNEESLSDSMRMELNEDLSWDRAATLAIQPTPKTALILPWCVALLQFYVFWRLMCFLTFSIAGKETVCSMPLFNSHSASVSEPQPADTISNSVEESNDDTATDTAINDEVNDD